MRKKIAFIMQCDASGSISFEVFLRNVRWF